MQRRLPPHILEGVERWDLLSRWERAELGRELRRLGWTYTEIMEFLPVPKGTLAGWCRDVVLSDEQVAAIRARSPTRRGVPRDTRRKRREEIEHIREAARIDVPSLIADPLWLAGTILYWAEGTKTQRRVELANSDPRALRLFMEWCRQFHLPEARFRPGSSFTRTMTSAQQGDGGRPLST